MSERSPMPPANADDARNRSRLIHREILQLAGLIVVAIAAFFLTRAVAASNRQMTLDDAEEWYRRGQQEIARGAVDDGVDAFRRATVRNRQERRYVLALAQALALRHDEQAARNALLTLREATPEDPVVNLALARLAAGRDDVPDALRYYHIALYAQWAPESAAERRHTRLELARLLLHHREPSRALAELMAVSSDLPDNLASHLEVAALFAEAGDGVHSLNEYEHALRAAPGDGRALAGAGQAAFQLGDYVRARGYLRQVAPDVDDTAHTLSVVDFVLSNDPLAAHIGTMERRRRLQADLSYAQQRWSVCRETRGADTTADRDGDLQHELATLQTQVTASPRLEQDTVEAGVDVIERIARQVAAECGPPTAVDQALLIIGRRHRADPS